MKKIIEFRKKGNFYYCYGDDALVVHEITGYKLNHIQASVGCPDNSIVKVGNLLENKGLSYKFYDGFELKLEKTNNIDNYSEYLKKAKNKFSYETKLNEILKKIEKLNEAELDKLIGAIDDFFC